MRLSADDAQTLRTLTQHVEQLTTELDTAKQDRDDAIRFALEAGAYPTEIGTLTGITRARIYQIKQSHR